RRPGRTRNRCAELATRECMLIAESISARRKAEHAATDLGCPLLEGPLALLDGAAADGRRCLAQVLDLGLNGLEPRPHHAIAHRDNGVAHAHPGVVERPAPGPRRRAAAAAARLLAGHLAFGPAHHAVELRTDRIEPRGDDRAGVACVLLQAGKSGAGRLLARDQAPPEPVSEADRPDGEEDIERE